jgi:hypothetical protein
MFTKSCVRVLALLFVLSATSLSAAEQSTTGSATIRTRDRGDWSSIVRIIKKVVRGVVKGNSDIINIPKP